MNDMSTDHWLTFEAPATYKRLKANGDLPATLAYPGALESRWLTFEEWTADDENLIPHLEAWEASEASTL